MYEGYTITLDTNVDLGAREENGTWATTANEAVKWSPIGDTKANTLKAKFDGQGHVVKGIYISGNALFSVFFGNSSSIYNLTVRDGYIQVGHCSGGIVGSLRSGEIVNCHNINVKVVGDGNYNNVGGIVGQAGLNDKTTVVNISKSYNTGNVNGNDGVGGISGKGGIVTNSYNTGNITGKDSKYGTGGIVGTSGTEGVNISLCYNSGTVTAPGEVGGISGYLGAQGKSAKVSQCYSKGNIVATSTTNVGALVGNMGSDAAVTSSFFLSAVGVNTGIGAINDGGDLNAQNAGAKSTTADVKTYSEFTTWIKSQN